MIDFLLPFQYEFFRNGIVVAVLVGGTCGLLGVYIILKGMSYIGHGMSNAVFGGAAVSFILSVNLYIGASIFGILSAFLINEISKRSKIKSDAAIGIVTTAVFALGIFFVSMTQGNIHYFEGLLFGNILGISQLDIIIVIFMTIITVLFFLFFHKKMLFSIFDDETANVFGIKTENVERVFTIILATVVIASMNAIGVTLLAAAIIAPAASARLLTNNFLKMILFSTIIGSITAFVGMYASFHFDTASGATIVLFAASTFGIISLYVFLKKRYCKRFQIQKI